MGKVKRYNIVLALLLINLLIFVSVINVQSVQAQVGGTCALSPEQVEGQGFRVSSLGFRVSSLGFRVSSLGFRVSSLGFRVSSLEEQEILEEMVNNQVTPAWLVNALPYVTGGAGYNSQTTHLLVIDDFSSSDAHGVKVKRTIQNLIDAVTPTPNIVVHEVDISAAALASDIAGLIGGKVEEIRNDVAPDPVNFVGNMSFGLTPCVDPGPFPYTLTDSETGETVEVTQQFSINELMAGAPEDRPFKRVSPVLECIVVHYKDGSGEDDGGTDGHGKFGWGPWGHHKRNIEGYTAYFGYNNPNLYPVEIPIGRQNRFHPFPKDRGQPTEFEPGRQRAVFSVDYSYGFVKWRLGHKWAFAWAKSPKCEGNEPPEMSSQIIRDGYSLTEYAQEQLGIPEGLVDEYYENLFAQANEPDTDNPFQNIQMLMRMYLEESKNNPNFSFVPVASAGNFAYLLGTDPLKPAAYPEVVSVSATVGDFGPLWRLSHFGDIRAPGVSVPLAYEIPDDPTSPVTEIGAGTSHSGPFVSLLYGFWGTYPAACDFSPIGFPPLIDAVLANRNQNAFFTGIDTPLDCAYNQAPELAVTFGGTMNENTWTNAGTVSDPDGDEIVSMTVDDERFEVSFFASEGGGYVWELIAPDNLEGELFETPESISVTATDDRGASTTIPVTVTVLNVDPTATLLANGIEIDGEEVTGITVNVGEVTLALVDPIDQSDVDTEAGFTYSFDCGYAEDGEYSSEGDELPPNTAVCNYSSAGEYVASATIFDKDDGYNTYDVIIMVESVEPSTCYASYVVSEDGVSSYQPGRRNDGSLIKANRMNPANALGAPQDNDTVNFVSLGFPYAEDDIPAGSIILGFDQPILNIDGLDVKIWETTYRDSSRPWKKYPEVATIYASMDGETWYEIGTTTDKDQAYDLGDDLTYANYIKLVDSTNPEKFSNSADGFDVDAVEGFDCGYIVD